MKEFFKSNHANKLLIVLAAVVVILFVFVAGIFIGHEKGKFSRDWGENYLRNVMGQRGRGTMDFGRPGFSAHSGLGQILKIEGNNLVVKGQDNVEKVIVISDKTIIRKFNQSLKLADLKVDDNIVVIGSPDNQGQIQARLIRVMPVAQNNANNATSTKQ